MQFTIITPYRLDERFQNFINESSLQAGMPITIINTIHVNALYYPVRENPQHCTGYLRVHVTNKSKTNSRVDVPHPYFEYFFIPFRMKAANYYLKVAELCQDIGTTVGGRTKREIMITDLSYPRWEQERLDTIIRKVQETMPIIVERAVPLPLQLERQRNSFRGLFPMVLQEDLEGRTIYATLRKGTKFTLSEGDLPSYQRENYLPIDLKKIGPLRREPWQMYQREIQ